MHRNSICHFYVLGRLYEEYEERGGGCWLSSGKGGMRWFSSEAQGRTYRSVWLRALSIHDNLSKRETAADWPLRRGSFFPGELILGRLNFKHLAWLSCSIIVARRSEKRGVLVTESDERESAPPSHPKLDMECLLNWWSYRLNHRLISVKNTNECLVVSSLWEVKY